MKKLKIVIAVLLVICILFSALLIVYNVRGNINSVELPQNIEEQRLKIRMLFSLPLNIQTMQVTAQV